jgi:hypothetical protein
MTQVNTDFPVLGTPTDVPYDANNFGATLSMTWAVDLADQVTYQFIQSGSFLMIWLRILNTTVGGTVAGANITIKLPNGLKAAKTSAFPFLCAPGGGASEGCIIATTAGSNLLTILRYNANWVLGSNNTDINGWIGLITQ